MTLSIDNQFFVSDPYLADIGGVIYWELFYFFKDGGNLGRRPIPSFIEFLQACEEGLSISEFFRNKGFVISENQLQLVLKEEGMKYLKKLKATKPLLTRRISQ